MTAAARPIKAPDSLCPAFFLRPRTQTSPNVINLVASTGVTASRVGAEGFKQAIDRFRRDQVLANREGIGQVYSTKILPRLSEATRSRSAGASRGC